LTGTQQNDTYTALRPQRTAFNEFTQTCNRVFQTEQWRAEGGVDDDIVLAAIEENEQATPSVTPNKLKKVVADMNHNAEDSLQKLEECDKAIRSAALATVQQQNAKKAQQRAEKAQQQKAKNNVKRKAHPEDKLLVDPSEKNLDCEDSLRSYWQLAPEDCETLLAFLEEYYNLQPTENTLEDGKDQAGVMPCKWEAIMKAYISALPHRAMDSEAQSILDAAVERYNLLAAAAVKGVYPGQREMDSELTKIREEVEEEYPSKLPENVEDRRDVLTVFEKTADSDDTDYSPRFVEAITEETLSKDLKRVVGDVRYTMQQLYRRRRTGRENSKKLGKRCADKAFRKMVIKAIKGEVKHECALRFRREAYKVEVNQLAARPIKEQPVYIQASHEPSFQEIERRMLLASNKKLKQPEETSDEELSDEELTNKKAATDDSEEDSEEDFDEDSEEEDAEEEDAEQEDAEDEDAEQEDAEEEDAEEEDAEEEDAEEEEITMYGGCKLGDTLCWEIEEKEGKDDDDEMVAAPQGIDLEIELDRKRQIVDMGLVGADHDESERSQELGDENAEEYKTPAYFIKISDGQPYLLTNRRDDKGENRVDYQPIHALKVKGRAECIDHWCVYFDEVVYQDKEDKEDEEACEYVIGEAKVMLRNLDMERALCGTLSKDMQVTYDGLTQRLSNK